MSVHISATTDPERHLSSAMDPITAAAFPIQHYEVTPGCLCCLVLCPETLVLETEEVEYKRVTPCSTDVKRLPYGQLGSVDKYSARPLPCTDPSASSALGVKRESEGSLAASDQKRSRTGISSASMSSCRRNFRCCRN